VRIDGPEDRARLRRNQTGALIILAGFVASLAFPQYPGFVAGTAVAVAAWAGARRRGLVTGIAMVLAPLPWIIYRNRSIGAALSKDLNDHRWTAYTMDSLFCQVPLTVPALAIAGLAFLAVAAVDWIRTRPRTNS
jgi:hypothetical protein